jgi:hypothetical protein
MAREQLLVFGRQLAALDAQIAICEALPTAELRLVLDTLVAYLDDTMSWLALELDVTWRCIDDQTAERKSDQFVWIRRQCVSLLFTAAEKVLAGYL